MKKEVEVVLQPLQIKEAVVKIKGDSPLIVNNFDEKSRKQMLDIQMKKAKAPRDAKNPVEDFMRSLHWITEMPNEFTEEAFEKALENGAKFGFPAVGIKASAISGAYRNKYSKDKVSIQGAFHIDTEMVEIKGVPTMREDIVRVANGNPDIRYRAEFKEWEMEFTIRYNENAYSLEQIINFINLGGFTCGVGEWRTEKSGIYGRYHVV